MKLFVGNIPHSLSENDLKELFVPFGAVVSVKIILDHDTGRSRGFAFVEMGSANEGKKAIDALNGKEVTGRAIVVTEARPQVKREGGPGGGGGFRNREPGMRRDREPRGERKF